MNVNFSDLDSSYDKETLESPPSAVDKTCMALSTLARADIMRVEQENTPKHKLFYACIALGQYLLLLGP